MKFFSCLILKSFLLITFTGLTSNAIVHAQNISPSFENSSEKIESTSLISKVDEQNSNNSRSNKSNNNQPNSDNLIYNIFIKTDKAIYLFALNPDVAVRLPYPDYNKKDDFTQWYNCVQYHESIMSDIEVLSDKKTVHAQLTYYPHLDNHDDMQKIIIYGERIDSKMISSSNDSEIYGSNNNNTNNTDNTYNTHASIDVTENAKAAHYNLQAFMLGFDSNWNTNDMNLKVDDNEKEKAYKRWHNPVKHLEDDVHNTTQSIISPFGLLFCHAPCLPGG